MAYSYLAPAFRQRAACAAIAALSLLVPLRAEAAAKTYGNQTITDAGDILRFAIPAAAAGISVYKDDYTGLAQLVVAWGATVGIAYGLKHVVHERRPDGSDWQSFPSDSAASAQAGAAYLWHRYGWEYGVPAEALSLLVGYSRVQAKQHHWYDVAASDVISFGVNYFVVSRYHKPYSPYHFGVGASPDGAEVKFSMDL